MEKAFKLHALKDGIFALDFDLPGEKVNKLSSPIMQELDHIIDSLRENREVKVLLIRSLKKGIFIAGADISEINDIHTKEDGVAKAESGQKIFDKLESLPFPTVSVINGACVGGGLELALACEYRIATDNAKTSIGLVEVSLGIIPGFGGTQRLPRLIGLQRALPLILAGKAVKAKKALKLNIIDALYPQEFIDEKSMGFAKSLLNRRAIQTIKNKRKLKGLKNAILENSIIGRTLLFSMAKKSLMKQTKGNYPAPLAALKTIKKTFKKRPSWGMHVEAVEFSKLVTTDVCQHMINLYYTNEAIKKDPGAVVTEKPAPIKTASVIGAGVMGGGISWLFSYRGIPVRMKDISWEAVAKGYESAAAIYKQLTKRRRLSKREANLNFLKISGSTDFSGQKQADIVVEAVVEDMKIKKIVLAELEEHVRPDAIIASNTSALSITEMATALKHPERFVGMHFFNPVNRMPLVEIIPGEKTSPETIARIVALTKSLRKTPIVVGNCPGFVVNRILLPYMNEALFLLEQGVDFERVDKLITRFGMPMGPFTLADEVGIDVCYKVANILEEGFGERMKVAAVVKSVYDSKLLGKKNNKGFYLYGGKTKEANPQINTIAKQFHNTSKSLIKDEDIINRCILMMVNEASKCLEEGIIEKPAYLDMAMIMGTGFPPFKGGLCRYADSLGATFILTELNKFYGQYGERFKPSEYLIAMEKNNGKFYND
jgi:3-hydroxyacyl-CoA dehydrogenase / enoyl-CoA hydratase / 3-hydroxybutyryl-CoA epimerase